MSSTKPADNKSEKKVETNKHHYFFNSIEAKATAKTLFINSINIMHCGIEDQTTSPIDKTLLDRLQDRINWAQEIIFVWFQLSIEASLLHQKKAFLSGSLEGLRVQNILIDVQLVKKRIRKKVLWLPRRLSNLFHCCTFRVHAAILCKHRFLYKTNRDVFDVL